MSMYAPPMPNVVGILLAVFALGCVMGMIGQMIFGGTYYRFQKEAVEAGKAEYYIDAEYQRQWRWKP